MAIRKIRDHVLKPDKTTDIIHYESSADIIVVQPVQGKITATNVQKALEDLADVAATGGVTSVNGKTGAVILGATDVGAEPAFAKNTAFNKNFGTDAGTVMEGNDTRVRVRLRTFKPLKGKLAKSTRKTANKMVLFRPHKQKPMKLTILRKVEQKQCHLQHMVIWLRHLKRLARQTTKLVITFSSSLLTCPIIG